MNQTQNERAGETFALLSDPAVRQRFQDDPRAGYEELRAQGVFAGQLAADAEVKVVRNTADTVYITFPEAGAGPQLSDAELEQMSAAGFGSISTAGSASSLGTACSSASSFGSAASAGTIAPDPD